MSHKERFPSTRASAFGRKGATFEESSREPERLLLVRGRKELSSSTTTQRPRMHAKLASQELPAH